MVFAHVKDVHQALPGPRKRTRSSHRCRPMPHAFVFGADANLESRRQCAPRKRCRVDRRSEALILFWRRCTVASGTTGGASAWRTFRATGVSTRIPTVEIWVVVAVDVWCNPCEFLVAHSQIRIEIIRLTPRRDLALRWCRSVDPLELSQVFASLLYRWGCVLSDQSGRPLGEFGRILRMVKQRHPPTGDQAPYFPCGEKLSEFN